MGKGERQGGGGACEGEEEKGGGEVGSNKTAEGKGRPAAAQRDTLQPPIGRQAGGDCGGGGCCRRSGGERMQEGSGEFGEVGRGSGWYVLCLHSLCSMAVCCNVLSE